MQTVKKIFDGGSTVIGIIEGEWVAKISSCIRLHVEVVTLTKNLAATQLSTVFTLKSYLELTLNLFVKRLEKFQPKAIRKNIHLLLILMESFS